MKLRLALVSLVLFGGCAQKPLFGVNASDMHLWDAAEEYPGLSPIQNPSHKHVDIILGQGDTQFRSGDLCLAVVSIPENWKCRVLAANSISRSERTYHIAVAQWETARGRRCEVAVKYLGPDDLFIGFNGEFQRVQPGVHFEVDESQTGLKETTLASL